jgi:transcriptional regulator with XRE-family HTH domain
MRLREWLEKEELSASQFAGRIGRSAEAVRRYVTGERIPDKDTMPLIVGQTGGEVMPNDFFVLSVNGSVNDVAAAAVQ